MTDKDRARAMGAIMEADDLNSAEEADGLLSEIDGVGLTICDRELHDALLWYWAATHAFHCLAPVDECEWCAANVDLRDAAADRVFSLLEVADG